MVQVAQLGKERFYKYARDFGFGITTGIVLPGEMRGR
jgi:cell division protein FtsI/penicillin-binding protein 2